MYQGRLCLGIWLVLAMAPSMALGQAEPATLSRSGNETYPSFTITNNAKVPITGFIVTVDLTLSRRVLTRYYFDVFVNYKHDYPIPHGDSTEMPLPRLSGLPVPEPVLRAVVFEDGSSWGPKEWVDEMLERRSILLERLDSLDSLFETEMQRSPTRESLKATLQQQREARAAVNVGQPPSVGC